MSEMPEMRDTKPLPKVSPSIPKYQSIDTASPTLEEAPNVLNYLLNNARSLFRRDVAAEPVDTKHRVGMPPMVYAPFEENNNHLSDNTEVITRSKPDQSADSWNYERKFVYSFAGTALLLGSGLFFDEATRANDHPEQIVGITSIVICVIGLINKLRKL